MTAQATTTATVQQTQTVTTPVTTTRVVTATDTSQEHEDAEEVVDESEVQYIALNGDSISLDGAGAVVSGSKITIVSAGTYSISGSLSDGQIVVDAAGEDTVRLILNGVDIYCSNSAPIYVLNADKTIITLADGAANRVSDGTAYVFEDPASDEPSAAIFSNDDLTINGEGSLVVEANYNHGIQSKDDLKINGGDITITAAGDGLKGRDSVTVKSGSINIAAGGDGIQSNNDEDAARGYIDILDGVISITAAGDGIQAETRLTVSGGDITMTTGGGAASVSIPAGQGMWSPGGSTAASTVSAKGLKAGVELVIDGGTINIDSADDALHSNGSITVNGGVITIASGDDAAHADTGLTINGGDITISRCYEGLESALITINDGNIHLTASDDGINVVGEGGDGFFGGMMPGFATTSGNNFLYINGGYVVIDAAGDGIDVNGSVEMTGGVVLVSGPTNSGNGALDYLSGFKVSGGLLVAVGSSGMAQAPDTSSSQYAVMVNFASTLAAGTLIHIEDASGNDILTFTASKTFQSVVLCSPELVKGGSYAVYTGGSASGAVSDGLYAGGQYTGGTQSYTFTVSSTVTTVGSAGGGLPGGGVPGGGGMRR